MATIVKDAEFATAWAALADPRVSHIKSGNCFYRLNHSTNAYLKCPNPAAYFESKFKNSVWEREHCINTQARYDIYYKPTNS